MWVFVFLVHHRQDSVIGILSKGVHDVEELLKRFEPEFHTSGHVPL